MIETYQVYAVLHKATRVVRGFAPNADALPADDEVLVELTVPRLPCTTGAVTKVTTYYVIEDGKQTEATKEQLAAGFIADGVKYWKVDDAKQILPATDAEVDAAGVDPVRETAKRHVKYETARAVIEALATGLSTEPDLRLLCEALLEIV